MHWSLAIKQTLAIRWALAISWTHAIKQTLAIRWTLAIPLWDDN